MKLLSRVLGAAPLRTLLWIVCVSAPLAWMQLARGYSIPSREPPPEPAAQEALSAPETLMALAPSAEPADEPPTNQLAASENPGAPKRHAVAEAATGAEEASEGAAEPSAATAVSGLLSTAAALEEADAASASANAEATPSADVPPASTSAGAEQAETLITSPEAESPAQRSITSAALALSDAADATVTEPTPESPVTIVVSEAPAEQAAPATVASTETIHEIAPAPAQVQPAPARPKRAARKAKRALLALVEPEQPMAIQLRSLSKTEAPHPTAGKHTVPALIGGRGVAARADLGRGSPLSGAAADVFATGHHVAALPNCEAYADNPYFREDAFGRTLRLSCQ